MDLRSLKISLLFLVIFAHSNISNALVIYEYDLTVDETYFQGPGSYGLNIRKNPNDVLYKRFEISPFTLEAGENYQFNFNFSQTVWLYDLGLPYGGGSFGETELIGPSFLLDNKSRLNGVPVTRDLDLRLSGINLNIDAVDASMNPNDFSFTRPPQGRGGYNGFIGSGFSPISFVDVTDTVLGINSIQIDFLVESVDFNGGASIFDYFDLRIAGDNVSRSAPISVNEPATSSLIISCIALLMLSRQRGKSTLT